MLLQYESLYFITFDSIFSLKPVSLMRSNLYLRSSIWFQPLLILKDAEALDYTFITLHFIFIISSKSLNKLYTDCRSLCYNLLLNAFKALQLLHSISHRAYLFLDLHTRCTSGGLLVASKTRTSFRGQISQH